MKKPKWLMRCSLALLVGFLPGCADLNRQPVAGRYFTTRTEDGDPILGIDDPQQGPVTLTYAAVTGAAAGYVAVCSDSCYLYPVAAATAEAARRARRGPFTRAACQQQVRQLTGDSLRLTAHVEF